MKIAIVSGYFNPLHGGHLDMIESAKALGDKLVVIINNDQQQVLKKGKVILDEQNRMRLMAALRDVDDVVLSVDTDPGQSQTLRKVRQLYPNDELIFCNGGDRDDMRLSFEQAQARKIEDLLSQTLGFGKVRAQVSAELDYDRITTNSEIYDPESQVVRSTQSTSENSANAEGGSQGVSVANNLPNTTPAGAGGSNSNTTNRSEETINYEIN
ncbi:hypothetical protein EBZ38_10850, partial [bacterium]|nr:hypothetical protein [bacterium]